VLRFLPNVERRAGTRTDRTKLAESLQAILRQWPLSGVLGAVPGPPTGDTAFAGHSGLQLLYAERLIRNGRPEWLPDDTAALSWCERIYHERGKPLPCPVDSPGDEA
jgi:hypothetical protein